MLEKLFSDDGLERFVSEYLEKDKESMITLKQIKEKLKDCLYYNGKANVLKNRLERIIGSKCIDRYKKNYNDYRSVFHGYKLIDT